MDASKNLKQELPEDIYNSSLGDESHTTNETPAQKAYWPCLINKVTR